MLISDPQRDMIRGLSRDERAFQQIMSLLESLCAANAQETRQHFEALFQCTNDAIFLINPDNTVRDVNQRAADMLGYTTAEMRGVDHHIFISPEEMADSQRIQNLLEQGMTPPVYERILRHRDGTRIPAEMNVAPVLDGEGHLLYYQSIARDISERKHLEAQLQTEHNLLRTVIDAIPDPIYVKDRDHRFTLHNRATNRLGRQIENDIYIGKTDAELGTPQWAMFLADEQRLIETGEPILNQEYERPLPNGEVVTVLVSKLPLRDDSGRIIGLVGINRDVTAIKTLQDNLQRERNLLRAVIDAIPDPIYVKDRESRFILVNEATWKFEEFPGPEALLGKSDLDISDIPELAAEFFEAEQRLMDTGEPINTSPVPAPYRGNNPGLDTILISKVPLRDENGRIIGLVGINRDVSRINQLENELRAERNLLRTLFDAVPYDIYYKDRQSRFVMVNAVLEEQLQQRTQRDVIGCTDADIFGPESADHLVEEQTLMTTGIPIINREFHIPEYDRTPERQWLLITKVPVRNDQGEIIGLIGVNQNITPVKQLEEELRAERNLLRSILDAIPDAIYVKDHQMRYILGNKAAYAAAGASSDQVILGKTTGEVWPGARDLADIEANDQQVLQSGQPILNKQRKSVYRNQVGHDATILVSKVPLRDESGQIIGIIGVNHDITENVQLQEQLHDERNLLRSILDAIPDAIYVKDRHNRFILINTATLAASGSTSPDAVLGKRVDEVWPDAPGIDELHAGEARLMETGEPIINQPRQSSYHTHLGEEHTVLMTKVPLRAAGGEIVGLIGINRDVTETVHLQDELRQERNLLRTIIDTIPETLYVKDREGRFILANQRCQELNLQAGCDNAIGKTDLEVYSGIPEAAEWYAEDLTVIRTGVPIINQEQPQSGDGLIDNHALLLVTKVPMRDSSGSIIGLIGIQHDVTNIRRLESELARERNTLRAIIDTIPDDIYVKDRQGRFILSNRANLRRLGMTSADELLGKDDRDLYGEIGAQMVAQEKTIFETGVGFISKEVQIKHLKQFGIGEWYLLTKVPLRDDSGEIIGLIGVNTRISHIKHLEESLRKERNLLRSIIDTIPDDLFVKDRDCRFVMGNQATLKRLNLSHNDQLAGKNDFDFFGPYAEAMLTEEQQILETAQGFVNREYFTTDFPYYGGGEWYLSSKVPLRDETGEIIGLIGMNTNISHIKHLEERLQAERNLLHSIIDTIPEEVYVKDRQSRFILLNKAALAPYGLTDADELIGKTDFDVDAENPEEHFAQEQALMERGDSLQKDTWVPAALNRPGAYQRWITITKVPLRDAEGNVIGLIGVNHNVTAIKQLQEQVQNERNLLRSIIDTIPDEVYVKDREGRFMLVNRATLEANGRRDASELLGKTDFDISPAHDAETFAADEKIVLETGIAVISDERQVPGRDMSRTPNRRWINITKVPLRDESGAIIGLIGVNHNITAVKELQIEVRNERNLLRSIIDAIPDAIYVKDRSHRFILINHATAQSYPEEMRGNLIGKSGMEIDSSFEGPFLDDEIRILETGEPVMNYEHRRTRKLVGGRLDWTLITKVPLRDEHGAIIGLIGINRDITALKRAQLQLEENQRFTEHITHTMPDLVYVINVNTGENVYTNRSVYDILGYSSAEIKEMGPEMLDTIMHPDDYEWRKAHHLQFAHIKDGEILESVRRFRHADGRWLWLQIRETVFTRDAEGVPLLVLGVAQDITERRAAEEQLRLSEARLRAIVSNFPNGAVFLYDHDLRYLIADGMMLKTYDASPEMLEGRTLAEFWPPEAVAFSEPIASSTLAGERLSGEVEFMGRTIGYLTQPIYNDSGQVIAGLTITQDVTARTQAERMAIANERLRVDLQKEQELSDLKAKMMMRISHEFRTPLSIIGTSTEMLERYAARMDDNRRREHYMRIAHQIERIVAMLDDITILMRAQTGGDIGRTCNLKIVCQESRTEFASRRAIDVSCDQELAIIPGSHEMLKHMIMALLQNAVQYSPEGSPVSLRGSLRGDYAEIVVTDQGIGIPEADRARIFEPFFRGSNINESQGIGLGLSIVDTVVKVHNGTIQVESIEGQGTTVTVRLPLKDSAEYTL